MLRAAKILAGLLWLGLLASGLLWGRSQGYGMVDLARVAYEHIAQHPYAPVAYIVIYTLRPLIFFPAMWLTILSGSLFGFWGGVIYTIIGENLSASLAYVLGRFFASDEGDGRLGMLARWRSLLDEQAFTSVLILRVIYAPFDVVNYGCGLLSVPWAPYALATLIGIMPGLITFVSFGASVDFGEFLHNYQQFSPGDLFDARQLLISGTLLALSLAIAWVVHRRHQRRITLSADA
ncbi:MAG: TVP38/TMEM64 family protein [Nevskiales bacterium]